MSELIKLKTNHRDLLCYQKAEAIYDMTYFFANKFLERGDRTRDQMVQAARSGKQNIIEGYAASATSIESEIKLSTSPPAQSVGEQFGGVQKSAGVGAQAQ